MNTPAGFERGKCDRLGYHLDPVRTTTKGTTMYQYSDLRPKLFTEEGSVLFTAIRDHVRGLLPKSGAITMGAAISGPRACGDSWLLLACVDRLVELEELREIKYGDCPGQNRIFVAGSKGPG